MKKIHIISLGCPKNTVDSEHLAGQIESAHFSLVSTPEEADVVLVNTCGFIQPAVEESIDVILDLESLKKEGIIDTVAVVGCMVNRYGSDLKKEFPYVDIWAESEQWSSVIKQLNGAEKDIEPASRSILSPMPWTRYLKVGEGCDTRCSFCTIPSIRGSLKSLSPEAITEEAIGLVEGGARELCLVGQDLTVYGSDLFGAPALPTLLDRLEDSLPEDIWIRLFYLHPSRVDEAFLERVLASKRIVPWLDVPIQHVDNDILRRMNRPPVEQHIREIFGAGRKMYSDFAFRTTIMVGFPGETDEAFEKLLSFVEDVRFDRLGAFTFYPEEGTPASKMDGQIPQEVKDARYAELMELQQEISASRQAQFIGKELDVLVEEIDEEDQTVWGRSFRDAPEIDGAVAVREADGVVPGDMIKVRINDAAEYDLFGEMVHSDGKY